MVYESNMAESPDWVKMFEFVHSSELFMKFQNLPLDTRFVYRGEIFAKASPLMASVNGGGQRMIPRYASLHPVDGVEIAAPAKTPNLVDIERVFQALETLQHRLSQSALDVEVVKQAINQCKETISA
jgi:hypothetical protein